MMGTLKFLSQFQKNTPINELLLILSKVTGKSTTALLIKDELVLTKSELKAFKDNISKLESGMPLAYVLGECGFYDHLFYVNPYVLIPRPETEQIIDLILAKWPDLTQKLSILDIGTGSGIIPITLALKYPSAICYATDISEKALEVAKLNSIRHAVEDRIELIQSDLVPNHFDSAQFSLITANLPYIPYQDCQGLEVIKNEPSIALIGGENGDELIKRFLGQVIDYSIGFDLMLLEIEYRQGNGIFDFCKTLFPDRMITLYKDLGGLDRIIAVQ